VGCWRLYESLIQISAVSHSALTKFASIGVTVSAVREKVVSDVIYLAAGVVVLLVFAGYAALLRRI
jgi:hypothetical protein